MKKRKKLVHFVLLMEMYFFVCSTYAQAPNWTINSADFSLDASLVGELKINENISTNTNDIVAIFDEQNDIRGVAKVSFNSTLNKYLIFLSIHSNTSGDKLRFKIYDAANDKILESTSEVTFTPNQVLGDAVNPFQIIASSSLSTANFNDKKTLDVFPNPVKNLINIASSKPIENIKLYSILGEEFLNLNVANSQQNQIDMHQFSKGIYLLKVSLSNNQIITKKIIKK